MRLVVLILSALSLPAAFAEESRADKAVAIVKDLCLTGKQFDLKVDANGNLNFKKLSPGAGGSFTVNLRESKGAAAIVDDKIRQSADEEIRTCIKPYISRIVDAVLADGPKLAAPASPLSDAQTVEEATRAQAQQVFLNLQNSSDAKCLSARPSLEPMFQYWRATGFKPTVWPRANDPVSDEQLRQRLVESTNSMRRQAIAAKNKAIDLGCFAAGTTKDPVEARR